MITLLRDVNWERWGVTEPQLIAALDDLLSKDSAIQQESFERIHEWFFSNELPYSLSHLIGGLIDRLRMLPNVDYSYITTLLWIVFSRFPKLACHPFRSHSSARYLYFYDKTKIAVMSSELVKCLDWINHEAKVELIYLLSHLDIESAAILPRLLEELSDSDDEVLQSVLLRSIGCLCTDYSNVTDMYKSHLIEIFDNFQSDSPIVYYAQIVGRTYLLKETIEVKHQDELSKWLATLSIELNWYGTVFDETCDAVFSTGIEVSTAILIKSLSMVETFERACNIVSALLQKHTLSADYFTLPSVVSIGNGFRDFSFNFSESLQTIDASYKTKIVEAIIGCSLFWTVQTNLLSVFGLPTTISELAGLIEDS